MLTAKIVMLMMIVPKDRKAIRKREIKMKWETNDDGNDGGGGDNNDNRCDNVNDNDV